MPDGSYLALSLGDESGDVEAHEDDADRLFRCGKGKEQNESVT